MNEKEEVNCDFCGACNFKEVLSSLDYYNNLSGVFTVKKCSNCGLVCTNPRPAKEHMKKYYPDSTGYYIVPFGKGKNDLKTYIYDALLHEYHGYFPDKPKNFFVKFILFPLFLAYHEKIRSNGIPNFVKGGKLLDVGCSYGGFLQEMKKKGWIAKGIEMNKKAALLGREKLKLDIDCADIDSFETADSFDVITLRMVLEHLYFPYDKLLKLKKLLREDGVLIISIPDFNGFERKIYGKYSYTLHLPNHLTHFTPTTIRRHLEKAGFKKIKIYHQSVDRDLIAPLNYMERDGKKIKWLRAIMKNKFFRCLLVKPLVGIVGFFGKTSRMTIYAKQI